MDDHVDHTLYYDTHHEVILTYIHNTKHTIYTLLLYSTSLSDPNSNNQLSTNTINYTTIFFLTTKVRQSNAFDSRMKNHL